jgi:hypothetical protein
MIAYAIRDKENKHYMNYVPKFRPHLLDMTPTLLYSLEELSSMLEKLTDTECGYVEVVRFDVSGAEPIELGLVADDSIVERAQRAADALEKRKSKWWAISA